MEPNIQKLFATMQEWGYIPKDADVNEFATKHADPAKQTELYNFLKSQGKVSMPADDFITTTFGVKKKEPGGQEPSQQQAPALAPSSSTTAPAQTAGIVSELDPTAGFPEPQKSVSEIQPGALPGPEAPLDPLQQMAGGPTPEFGQVAPGQAPVGGIPRENAGVQSNPFQQPYQARLTGEEDVIDFADELRKSKGGDFDARMRYDTATPYRAAKRKADNAVLYGEEANKQIRAGKLYLDANFGTGWEKGLAEMSAAINNPATPPEQAQVIMGEYNKIVESPQYKMYADGIKALGKAETAYTLLSQDEAITSVDKRRREIQKKKESEGVSPSQYFLETSARTGARLVSGILALPRTVGGAMSEFTGIENKDGAESDFMSVWSDKLSEYVDTELPKTSDLERATFERVVDYGDGEAVVDTNGRLQAVYGPDGFKKDIPQKEIDEFNKSGLGDGAKTRFSSAAGTLDKVYEMAGDMFVARGLGAGTKIGTVATTFVQTHSDAYDEAMKELDADPNEAAVYAATTAAITGVLEAYLGDIETTIGKPAKMAKALNPKDARALMDQLGPRAVAMARMEPIIKQVVGENAEEFAQKLDDIYARTEFNEKTGADMNTEFTKEEMMETALLTTLMTAPLSSTQSLGVVDDMKRRAVFALAENPQTFQKLTASMVDAGSITEEQAATYNDRAAKIASYAQGLDQSLTPEQRGSALAKEWNRMEAQGRSKNEAILPAQANEAKKVASALEAEIVQDIQPKPIKIEVIEEEQPVSATTQPEVVTIGSKTIAKPAEVETEAVITAPLQVEQTLPEAFVESKEKSTAVAEGYSMEALASTVDVNDPAVRDEIGNIALQELRNRGYVATEAEAGAIKRFFADSLSDTEINQNVTIGNAFGMLAEEYMDTMTDKGPLRNRLDIDTLDDQIAAFFAGGGQVTPVSYDRHGDPNFRKDKSVSAMYFKKNARALDDLANEWVNDDTVNTQGLDEQAVVERIVDFMHQYGKKNINDYLAARVEAQESEKKKVRMRERFAGKEDIEEVEKQAEKEVDAITMTAETESKLDEWLDQFADDQGNVDVEAMRKGIELGNKDLVDDDFDADAAKRWQELGIEGQNAIHALAKGRDVQKGAESTQQNEVMDDEGVSFEDWSADYRNNDGSLNVDKIKKEWDVAGEFEWAATVSEQAYKQIESIVNEKQTRTDRPGDGQRVQEPLVGRQDAETAEPNEAKESVRPAKSDQNIKESPSKAVERLVTETSVATSKEALDEAIPKAEAVLQELELPTKLTTELAYEMADQGIIKFSDAQKIEDHFENEAELPKDLLQDVTDKIPELREVPEWLAILDAAQVEHTKNVIRGDKRPGEMYTAGTPDGGIVFGNADNAAAKLKEAGAVKRGRGWYASPEVRDAVLASVYGPGAKFSMVADGKDVQRAGSMEGPVTRFFRRQFGNAQNRRLKDAIKKAKSVDEKIAVAKRMTRGANIAQAKKIAETLSKKFGIDTVMDQDGIVDALAKMGRPDLVMPDGTVSPQVRGFFYNDKVYVNLDASDTETPIHEFGHVFLAAIKDTPLYARFEAAIRGSIYEAAVRDNPMYEGMSDADILEEAMALAIGQRGAALSDVSAWLRFADMLDSLWAQMKALFGIDVQDMNAREFADYMATMVMEDSTAAIDTPNSQAPAFLFLGEKALGKREETAVNLATARDMENQGIDERLIWMTTGWFRGVDGMWRYEIPDAYSGISVTQGEVEPGAEYLLSEVFDHPELYSIDPSIGNVRVRFEKGSGTFYMPFDQGVIYIDVDGINKRADGLFEMGDLKHQIIHEVQHHIQRTEGFARGGSPTMGKDLVAEARKKNYAEPVPGAGFNLMAMEASGADAAYRAMAGEVEARLAADRKASPTVTREMPLDAMDIAPENQILVFPKKEDTVENLAERAAKMDPLKAPFITARFLFGRNRVVDAGKVAAARQIIRDRLNIGIDPNTDGAMVKLKKELGLSDATLSKIFAEEMKDAGRGRIVSPSGKRAFKFDNETFAKTIWKKWFTPEKGLPKPAFDAKNEWHRNVKAIFYHFQQKMGKLEDKVIGLTGNNARRVSDIFQQINNVLVGRQELSTLHPDLQNDVIAIRKELDDLSRNLVLSGAVESRDMAFTILQNAGVEISDANRPWAKMVVSAMRKNPAERTDAENDHIQQFLATYGDNLGTYLYRSYRANEVKNWKERVTDDVKERAREVIRKMALDKMQAEVDALDDKNMPLNDMVEDLKVQLSGHIDTVKKAIFNARLDLNQAIQDQVDYGTTGKGKEDAILTAKMKRQRERLAEAEKRVEKEQADLDKIIASQRQFQRTRLKVSKALAIQELSKAKKLKEARINVAKIRDQIQETMTEQQIRRNQPGRINKTIAKREQANLRKMDAALVMLDGAQAAANMPASDFYMMQQQAGWNPGPTNAVLRSIYARRKEIMALEERMERANAASYERLQYFENALKDPDAEIDVILTRDSVPAGILKSGRLGSKDLSVITGRRKSGEELPEEIRDLLGEYTDARVNVMRSVYRIANTIEAANFLFATAEAGLRDGWLSPIASSEGNRTVRIAPEGSVGMGPLAGLYTTAAIADAINSYNDVAAGNAFTKFYFKVRGLIKTGLTVLSPGGQGRNMYSNLMLATSMGWLNPVSRRSWTDFVRGFAAYNKTQDVKMRGFIGRAIEKVFDATGRAVWVDVDAEIEDAIKRGVVGSSLSSGDLRASARYLDGVISEGYGELPLLDAEIETKMGKIAAGAYDIAQRGYEGTDTLLKLWGFKQEQRKYAEALYGKKLEDLTPEQLEDVKNRAAEVMRLTTPDYQMLPKLMELMRQWPIFNTFLAWQMEMYRNTINRVNLGIREIKDERTRAIGIKRIAGGAAYAAAVFGSEIASLVALGMDDEERDALVPLMKPWEQNVSKIFLSKNDETGEITYYNIGQTDPYSFWKKPILAMYNNSDSFTKSLGAGFEETTKQLVAPELTFAIMSQMLANRNFVTGKKLTLEGYGRLHPENIKLQLEFIRKRAQPGFMKPIFDIYDASTVGAIDEYGNVKTAATIGLNTIGIQVSKIKPKVAFENKIKSLRFIKADIEAGYMSLESKQINNFELAKEGNSTPEQLAARREKLISELNERYDLMNPAYQEHLKEVKKIVKEARDVLKLDPTFIYKELESNRYNKYEIAVIYGDLETWNIERKIK